MNIIFLTHYFPPEVGAPQARLSELAQQLGRRGHRVTVLAPFPHYPTGIIPQEYRGRVFMREKLEGLKVVRTWVYAAPNRGFYRRLLNHLSFTLTSPFGAPFCGPADAVVVESPPLFLGWAGFVISRLKGAAFVFNVSDLWPASAVALGALRHRPLIGLAEGLEMFFYRQAAQVTVVTQGIYQALLGRGVPAEKLAVVPNGVDTSFFRPDADGTQLRAKLALGGKFVVLYAGTHGLAQGLETAVEAARHLTHRDDIAFLLVGDGAEKERLVRLSARYQLRNVLFLEPQPKAVMPYMLAVSDACLVPLKNLELFRGAMPSKMFEAMAAGRPIILAVAGEAADLVREARAGLCIPPEDPQALAAAVLSLRDHPELGPELGRNGRKFVEAHFSREKIAAQLEAVLSQAVSRRR